IRAPRVSNGRMTRSTSLLPALAAVLAAAGCAAPAGSMDARYEASLLRWQDATHAQLEAAWGAPTLAQATPGGGVLTWIVRTNLDDRSASGAPPVVVVTRAGGGAGATIATATPALVPPTVPITCTTHFVLKDGRVTGWKFEGLGCGAPT